MSNDLVIDLETLGIKDDAVILQVAMVSFDNETFEVQRGWNWFLNMHDQANNDRHIEVDTLAWWMQQSDEAREVIQMATRPESHSLEDFKQDFWETWKAELTFADVDCVWAQGTKDQTWMESLLGSTPWNYWQYKDIRTVETIAAKQGFMVKELKEKLRAKRCAHNALDDCMIQIEMLKAMDKWLTRGRS